MINIMETWWCCNLVSDYGIEHVEALLDFTDRDTINISRVHVRMLKSGVGWRDFDFVISEREKKLVHC